MLESLFNKVAILVCCGCFYHSFASAFLKETYKSLLLLILAFEVSSLIMYEFSLVVLIKVCSHKKIIVRLHSNVAHKYKYYI